MPTLFSKIIAGTAPAKRVFENQHLLAFEDIAPVAPVHVLIVPKIEIVNLAALQPEQMYLLAEIVRAGQEIARRKGIAASGYRLLTNSGPDAGQTIDHLHFHLIGGRLLRHLA